MSAGDRGARGGAPPSPTSFVKHEGSDDDRRCHDLASSSTAPSPIQRRSNERRAAPLEPKETIGRRGASTCSADFYVAAFGYVSYFAGQLNPAGVRCRVRRLRA